MKKCNALVLSLIILMQYFTANVSAGGTSTGSADNNPDTDHTSKILAKFSIPITAFVGVMGIGGYVCYKYKHRNRKIVITGDITQEKLAKAFEDIEKMQKDKHKCTLVFQSATIKTGILQNKDLNCDVLFTGQCRVDAGACNQTLFKGNFEIDGTISDGSSFAGANFVHKDLIIKGKIPQNLFHGAKILVSKDPGAKYRMPGKPEIVYKGQNLQAVQNYLAEYFK